MTGQRAALVTGGGRGIGAAISIGLAEDGFDIAIGYRKGADEAEATAEAIRKLGRRVELFQADVGDRASCEALVESAAAAFPNLDALVSNAGIASRGRSIVDTDPDEMARVLAVHAFAPYWLARVAAPIFRKRERSDIVVISSVATLGHAANGAPYNMGKAACEAFALTLAKEERPHGMHVNIVAPGLVDTDMGRRLAGAVSGVKDIHELDARMPFGRVCAPEDIADVVRFLVSPRAGYITGEKINVHGGGQNWSGR